MQELDESSSAKGESVPKLRVDGAELKPPTPHAFAMPHPADIRRLTLWLEREDVTLDEFGAKLARYGGLSRYVCAVASYRGRSKDAIIRDPVHAAAFLGIRNLQNVLRPLAEASVTASSN